MLCPRINGAIAALVYIDENRLLKRLDSGDFGIRFKAAYPLEKASSGESLSCLDFISLSPGLSF
jgi:hypothetical protein